MKKGTAQLKYFRHHKKKDRRTVVACKRDPMKKLLKRLTNKRIRQGHIAVDGAYFRRIVDVPWILY